MTGLVLLGGGGLAREVIALLGAAARPAPVGILDEDPARWGTEVDGVPVLGGLDLVAGHDEWALLPTVGQGRLRRELRRRLLDLGVGESRFASVVHPHVVVPPGCEVGRGCVIMAGVVLTAAVAVGDGVVAMPGVLLTHDVVVEEHATLCAGVCLAGGVQVGAGAYLGTSSSAREHVRIGADATLGMGAVLLEDLPAGETWVGNPARPLTGRPSVDLTDTTATPTPRRAS